MTQGRSLSVLVHANTKVGKSTFANTTPAPRLFLDVEAASRFLPGKKVYWKPHADAPPPLGDWETCVVSVQDYATFTRVLEWLRSGQHPFRSVVIDSISELQTTCKENLSGTDGAMSIRLWGDLLTHMERTVRAFRDLTEHPTKPLQAVVLTAMTEQRDGKWRPYVQGKLQVKLPYFLDVIGYLYIEEVADPNDPTAPPRKVRKMLVVPHPQFEAGERVQGRLGSVVENPTITGMLDTVFGPADQEENNNAVE